MILNSWTERRKCISVLAHQPRQQCIYKLICTFPDDLCGIACTQARSRVAYLSQRIPALAGPCDGWQVWGRVWELLPMWMSIIIIVIVITNIIIIMCDSPLSNHCPVCLTPALSALWVRHCSGVQAPEYCTPVVWALNYFLYIAVHWLICVWVCFPLTFMLFTCTYTGVWMLGDVSVNVYVFRKIILLLWVHIYTCVLIGVSLLHE